MRCKPGDLAIVTKATLFHEAIGHLVEVIELVHGPGEVMMGGQLYDNVDPGPSWVIRFCNPLSRVPEYRTTRDHFLLPIRPEREREHPEEYAELTPNDEAKRHE